MTAMALDTGLVELPHRPEQSRRGFLEISALAEIEGEASTFRHIAAEGEQRFIGAYACRLQPELGVGCVMSGELSGRGDCRIGSRHGELLSENALDILTRGRAEPEQDGRIRLRG